MIVCEVLFLYLWCFGVFVVLLSYGLTCLCVFFFCFSGIFGAFLAVCRVMCFWCIFLFPRYVILFVYQNPGATRRTNKNFDIGILYRKLGN